MRVLSIIFFCCAVTYMALPAHHANAASVPTLGGTCSEIGNTFMTNDKLAIWVCICNTSPKCDASGLVWKTMTLDALALGTINCPYGKAITKIVNGTPQCKAYLDLSKNN